MKRCTFRQWIVYVMMNAMLFSMVAPNVCGCEDCPCITGTTQTSTDPPAGSKKCCCTPPDTGSHGKSCSESPQTPCPCCDNQKDHGIVPEAVSFIDKPDFEPLWGDVPSLSIGSTNVNLFPFGGHRVLLSPHVPLHVLLCAFLN